MEYCRSRKGKREACRGWKSEERERGRNECDEKLGRRTPCNRVGCTRIRIELSTGGCLFNQSWMSGNDNSRSKLSERKKWETSDDPLMLK